MKPMLIYSALLALFTVNLAQADFDTAARLFDQQNYQQAKPLLEQSERNGDVRASFLLCVMYEQGLGVEIDLARSFHLCHRAADLEMLPAMALTAEKYVVGRGTQANVERGISLYEKAATGGYLFAQIALAQIYAGAIGVERFDPQIMMRYLNMAAAQGQPEGLIAFAGLSLALADMQPNQHWGKVEAALDAMTQAANMNNPDAQFALAEIYFKGHFAAADAANSLFWYTLADRAGHPQAKQKRFDLELSLNTGIRSAVARKLSAWQPKSRPQP